MVTNIIMHFELPALCAYLRLHNKFDNESNLSWFYEEMLIFDLVGLLPLEFNPSEREMFSPSTNT